MSKARTLASTVSTGAVLADGTIDAAEVSGAQPTLVSGTNIKTVNSTSLLGSGDVAVQPTLVSGTSIKTINGTSLLGSGDVAVTGGMTLLATATVTAGTTFLNVTGLASSKQFVVIAIGVTLSASSNVRQKLSVNNGSTFPGISVALGSTGLAPVFGAAYTYNADINASKRIVTFSGTTTSTETDATINAGVVNAMRFETDGAATYSTGTFYIYGIN